MLHRHIAKRQRAFKMEVRASMDASLYSKDAFDFALSPWHLKRMRVAKRQRALKMLDNSVAALRLDIDDLYSFSVRRWVEGHAAWMSAVTRALEGGP